MKDGKIDERKNIILGMSTQCLLLHPCAGPGVSCGGPLLSTGPEIVPGLELRLVVSPDEKRCNLWLGQTKDLDCGFASIATNEGDLRGQRDWGVRPGNRRKGG